MFHLHVIHFAHYLNFPHWNGCVGGGEGRKGVCENFCLKQTNKKKIHPFFLACMPGTLFNFLPPSPLFRTPSLFSRNTWLNLQMLAHMDLQGLPHFTHCKLALLFDRGKNCHWGSEHRACWKERTESGSFSYITTRPLK